MSVFSTNQTRHLYVAKSSGTVAEASTVGTIEVGSLGEHMYFKYKGEGGLTRSDLIDVNSIMYATYTPASKMKIPLKTVEISFKEGEKVVAGQDYILRITFTQMAGMSADTNYTKFGVVRGLNGMDAAAFMKAMEASLKSNFKREATELLDFTANSGTLTITEKEQPWALGTQPYYPLIFEVTLAPIMVNGVETAWGKTTKGTGSLIGNGKQIADLEYFCMGERGEIHRGMGYPYNIQPKGLVDSTKDYDVINIHYAYVGSNESVQKSEKDITIVCDTTDTSLVTSIKSAITGKGVTIEEPKNEE